MKKSLTAICLVFLLLSVYASPVSAAYIGESFFLTESYVYLPGEMTVGEMKEAFGSFELNAVTDSDGNELDEDGPVPTGAQITFNDGGSPDGPQTRTAVLMGDVDRNGKVELRDARKALRIAVGLEEAEDYAVLLACDVNCTANETVYDARSILRVAVNLDPSSRWFALRRTDFVSGYILVTIKTGHQNPDGIYEPCLFDEDIVRSVDVGIIGEKHFLTLHFKDENLSLEETERFIRRLYDNPIIEYASMDYFITVDT